MANIKFSGFTSAASLTATGELVGYDGVNNIRLTKANLESSLDLSNLSGLLDLTTQSTGEIDLATQVSGVLPLAHGGTGQGAIVTTGVPLVGYLLDEGTQVIEDNLKIVDSGGGVPVLSTGPASKIAPPSLQMKITNATALFNTNNGADFLVPYNDVIVNDDPTIYVPEPYNGTTQFGKVQIQQAGRYMFQIRYSSFDLLQPGLPTVDGTKFLRITVSSDVSNSGTAGKQCTLQNLIVATSANGEASVSGSGIMDFAGGEWFGVVGFHTGATGGSGTQGFPVNSNAFFNEPMLWMVKIG
jgi:hypothetical protein